MISSAPPVNLEKGEPMKLQKMASNALQFARRSAIARALQATFCGRTPNRRRAHGWRWPTTLCQALGYGEPLWWRTSMQAYIKTPVSSPDWGFPFTAAEALEKLHLRPLLLLAAGVGDLEVITGSQGMQRSRQRHA